MRSLSLFRASFFTLPFVFSSASARVLKPRSNEGLEARCTPSAIKLPPIGAIQVLNVAAEYSSNATIPVLTLPSFASSLPTLSGLNYCNVTVTYTHPGWSDAINVNILLPQEWNERFLAIGGGGWASGAAAYQQIYMLMGRLQSFAVAYTDGGHIDSPSLSDPWPLISPGNPNWPLLVDFGSLAIHELAVIGKALVQAYYEKPAPYSYYYGASQGGRQGHMQAQRFPEDFDGLVAHFPAIYWNRFFSGMRWPVFVMDKLGVYPSPCELDAFTFAAIEQCDELDGVKDGIVSHPWACTFEPESIVGTEIECSGFSKTLSSEAASIMKAIWEGPQSSTGEFQWYGYDKSANLTSLGGGIAHNKCNDQGNNCEPEVFPLGFDWLSWVVKRDPENTGRNISHQEWDDNFDSSLIEFQSLIETNDDDLSRFKRSGAKLINWHGTRDQLIPFNGSTHYVDRLLERDPNTADYYRLFVAPATDHGFVEGLAPSVNGTLSKLIDWVENGIAPETLDGSGLSPQGVPLKRDLCLYPRVQHYNGGDITVASSYTCV